MSLVLTVTDVASREYRICLRSSFRSTLENKLDELARFFVRHKDKDKLTLAILSWAEHLTALDIDQLPNDSICKTIGREIQDLVHWILPNPISKTPYKNPIWFHGWVLEQSLLKYYKQFDGHPVENINQYPPHVPAKEIIDWTRGLIALIEPLPPDVDPIDLVPPLSGNPPRNLDAILKSVPPDCAPEIIETYYEGLANAAIAKRNAAVDAEKNEQQRQENLQVRANLRQSIAEEVEQLNRMHAADQQRVQEGFAAVAANHQRAANTLHTQLSEERANQAAIHAADQRTIGGLNDRIQRAVVQTHQLENDLDKEKQTTQALKAEQQRLLGLVNSLGARVSHLENDKGGGFCTIA